MKAVATARNVLHSLATAIVQSALKDPLLILPILIGQQ